MGGGNSAIEAAVTLSEQNKVCLSYRGSEIHRAFKENHRKLNEAMAAGRIELLLNSTVSEFGDKEATLRTNRGSKDEIRLVPYDHAFVLVWADIPREFLKLRGLSMENEWEGSLLRAAMLTLLGLFGLWVGGSHTNWAVIEWIPGWTGWLVSAAALGALVQFGRKGDRFSWLGLSFFVWYTVYGVKFGKAEEFWPYRDWGYRLLSFFDRPWSFWYTVLYTTLMTVFGVQALKRWGLDSKDKSHIWRYVSLISFQWVFFFLVPEFLFQSAVKYHCVGAKLASNPAFAGASLA